jgi:hypothetical protein
MAATTQAARSGLCDGCQAKYTIVFTIEDLGGNHVGNATPFTCPKCGHGGTVTADHGRRIVRVEVRPYIDALGT